MSERTLAILEQLKALTLVETSELVKQIEETFNVDASPQPVFALGNLAQVQKVEEEVKTEFDLVVELVPADKKISVLKVVRSLTGLGLKEAKEFVESVPKVLKSGITQAEADELKKELESSGAKVSIK
jgi:large subunit ribosomal protein L7/L12